MTDKPDEFSRAEMGDLAGVMEPKDLSLLLRRVDAGKVSLRDLMHMLRHPNDDDVKAALKQMALDEVSETVERGLQTALVFGPADEPEDQTDEPETERTRRTTRYDRPSSSTGS